MALPADQIRWPLSCTNLTNCTVMTCCFQNCWHDHKLTCGNNALNGVKNDTMTRPKHGATNFQLSMSQLLISELEELHGSDPRDGDWIHHDWCHRAIIPGWGLGDGNHNFVTFSNFAEHRMLGITRTEPIKARVVGNIQEELWAPMCLEDHNWPWIVCQVHWYLERCSRPGYCHRWSAFPSFRP